MDDRMRGYIQITMAYGVAIAVACAAGWATPAEWSPIYRALVADVVGTVTIFAFSFAFNNTSYYDPYWSVAPIPIAIYFALQAVEGVPFVRQALAIGVVVFWGMRLTLNFLSGWSSHDHEDWRYRNFRESFPRAYWAISLAGLHMFPTLIVFVGCLALYPALATGTNPLGILDAVAFVVGVGAVVIEGTADIQLRRFVSRRTDPGQILDEGLWRYSRHPNYFGEIMFWWSLFFFALAADSAAWWTIAGPISMVLLFVVVSIPLLERRSLERRPQYAEHRKKVSALVPWFRRRP